MVLELGECSKGMLRQYGGLRFLLRNHTLRHFVTGTRIESLREKHRGMKVLNNFHHHEIWKPIINAIFGREKDHVFSRECCALIIYQISSCCRLLLFFFVIVAFLFVMFFSFSSSSPSSSSSSSSSSSFSR